MAGARQRASPAGSKPWTLISGGAYTRQQAAGGPVICDEGEQWPQGTKCPHTLVWRCTQATATHVSPAHFGAGLSTSLPDYAELCSVWQDTSWHDQAYPCQPPAWIPSPPAGQTPSTLSSPLPLRSGPALHFSMLPR